VALLKVAAVGQAKAGSSGKPAIAWVGITQKKGAMFSDVSREMNFPAITEFGLQARLRDEVTGIMRFSFW
jgi:hypothetical protein